MRREEFNQFVLSQSSIFLKSTGVRVPLLVGMIVFGGLIQGAGLMMLIPLLQIIGVGGDGSASSPVTDWIGKTLSFLGFPLSLPAILAGFVLLVASQALLTCWQASVSASIVQQCARALQNQLFREISYSRWVWILRQRASDLTHLLTQDVSRIGFGVQQAVQLAADLVLAGVYLGASLVISVPLSSLALSCGLVLFILLRPLNQRSQRAGERLRDSSKVIYSAATEHLSSLKLAKSFGRESAIVDRFAESTAQVAQVQVDFVRIRSVTQLLYQVAGAVALALFIYAAAGWLEMPPAEYLVMIVIFSRLLPRVSALQQTWQHLKYSLGSFEAARETLEDLRDSQEENTAALDSRLVLKDKVEFRDVHFSFARQAEPTLSGITLEIPAGKITGILGLSGAGKTTLADLIIGLGEPGKGSIRVDGVDLAGERIPCWRRSVGYVPQENVLYHDTIRYNLSWANPTATDSQIRKALELAAADDFVYALPEGLETVVGDRGNRMSGGEKQRIALARALLIEPTLLLLDEATSQVDKQSQDRILEAVSRLRGKMTVVIIAHHAPIEEMADQIIVLENGTVREIRQTEH